MRQGFLNLSGNARGCIWMALCGLGFSVMAAFVKLVGQAGINTFEITFFRCFIGFLMLVPFIVKTGPRGLHTQHLKAHVLRSGLGIVAMACSYLGIAKLELATYTALSFTKPLFAVLLAVIILKEDVRWRRWAATIVGFLGVLVMMQPGSGAFNPWALLALGDAMSIALLITILKRLPASETPLIMLFYYGLIATALVAPPAIYYWQWPEPIEWLYLIIIGATGAMSQYWWILAFKAGEASVVAPFDYLRLLFAGAVGFMVFAELPDHWTLIGAGLIISSTVYIAQREARLGQSQAKLPGT
ncbi:MAG: DMT family transporter [Rhodospirillaceae bacterium]|nr:DMT family transporter [Rhodospirillaceae bacterium]